jgi:hypothetical protein
MVLATNGGQLPATCAPSSVSPLAADENSAALSVVRMVPPRRAMADSKERRVRVEGS